MIVLYLQIKIDIWEINAFIDSENEGFNNNININNDINHINNINNINNNNPNFQHINFEDFNEIYNHISAIDNNLSLHQQSLKRGLQLDWSEERIFRKEEGWLINQLYNSSLNNNNYNDNEPQERDNEREIVINRNNSSNYHYISLNINDSSNINDVLTRRIIENIIFEFDLNYYF